MTAGPPLDDCVVLAVKSSVPSAQLVEVMVPALESMVVVPVVVQLHAGEVLKLTFHCVASTSTDGGTETGVHAPHAAPAHKGVPPLQAWPQLPQLAASV